MLAKLLGAEVIACASSDDKLRRLKEIGADEVVDYTKTDWSKWAVEKYGKPQRRTYEGGVDVVVNFTGGDTWVPSLRCLKRGGKLLVCGATAGYDPKEDLRYVWSFEIEIKGSNSFYDDDLAGADDDDPAGPDQAGDRQGAAAGAGGRGTAADPGPRGVRQGGGDAMNDKAKSRRQPTSRWSRSRRSSPARRITNGSGCKVVAVHDDGIELKATWREEWVVNLERRFTHGGILAALVDLGADWAMVRKTRPRRADHRHARRLSRRRAAGRSHHQGQDRAHGRPVLGRRGAIFDARASCWRAGAAPITPRRLRRRRRDSAKRGRFMRKLILLLILAALPGMAAAQADNPEWAYPVTPPPQPLDSVTLKTVPGSTKQYTQAQIDEPSHSAGLVSRRASADAAHRRGWRHASADRLRAMSSAVGRRSSGIVEPRRAAGQLHHPADGRPSRTASARASAPTRWS